MTQNQTPETPKPVFTEKARVGDLKVDRTYQRPFSEAWVSQFFPQKGKPARKQFDARAVQIPSISLRDDGMYLLDGQHRAKLVERLFGPDYQMLVAVYENLTVQQEADLCRLLNDNRAQRPEDRYRIALAAGEPLAVALHHILARYGFAALGDDDHTGKTTLRFTAGLLEMIQDGGVMTLDRITNIVRTCWGEDGDVVKREVWIGLYALMAHYHPAPEWDARLIERLRTKAAIHFVRAGNSGAGGGTGSLRIAVAQEMVRVYNLKKQGQWRLPDWDNVTGKSFSKKEASK
jgi:hypothetical protein